MEALGIFSRKFSKAQVNYDTYDRELTAIYEAIKYFRYFLEAQKFHVRTDHEALIHAFEQRSDVALPRRRRQLCFISQFTTDIRRVPGTET